MLQSIENNAGIIGEDLALLRNYVYFLFLKTHLLNGKNAHCRIMYHYPSCCNTTASIDFVCNVQVFIII